MRKSGSKEGGETRVPLFALLVVTVCVTVEAATNWLRGYEIVSAHDTLLIELFGMKLSFVGLLVGSALAGASVYQGYAVRIALNDDIDKRRRVGAGVLGAAMFITSALAINFQIEAGLRAKSGAERQSSNAYGDARKLYESAAEDFDRVKGAPSPVEAEAMIETRAAEIITPRTWRRTNKCADATKDSSISECNKLAPERAALAAAIRKAELEAQLPELKADMERHTFIDAASTTESFEAKTWARLIGLIVVFVSTFGLWIATERVEPEDVSYARDEETPVMDRFQGVTDLSEARARIDRRGATRADPEIAEWVGEFKRMHNRKPGYPEMRVAFPDIAKTTAWRYAQGTN